MSLQMHSTKVAQKSDSTNEPMSPTDISQTENPLNSIKKQLRDARALAQIVPESHELNAGDYWGPVRLPDLYPIIGMLKPEAIISKARLDLKNHFGVTNLDFRERIDLTYCLQTALRCLVIDDQVAITHNKWCGEEGPFRLLKPIAEGILRWIEIRIPNLQLSPIPNLYLQHKLGEPTYLWNSFKDTLFQARVDWRENYVTVGAIHHLAFVPTTYLPTRYETVLNEDSLIRPHKNDEQNFDSKQLKA